MNKFSLWSSVFVLCCYCEIGAADNSTLLFPHACEKGNSIIIAAVGDVLIHHPLLVKANQLGFASLWQDAIYYIKSADIAYANLEGPIATDINENGHVVSHPNSWLFNQVYTSYPSFNYPPTLGLALKQSGFAIVSTGNNHALDRFSIGVDKTIAALDKLGIAHIGTREKNATTNWVVVRTKNNIKTAWIACSEHTNDNPDQYHQVLHCYGQHDRPWIMHTIQQLKNQVDAIIITPHWGEEYQTHPNQDQIEFAHEALNAGATAIIGSHPHVLQPLQKYITKDGRATLIMYSLGNFVSYQNELHKRCTVILLLGLTKTAQGTFINGVEFVPMYMQNHGNIKSIHLEKLNKENMTHASLYSIFSRILPMGNALYSNEFTTHPSCDLSK